MNNYRKISTISSIIKPQFSAPKFHQFNPSNPPDLLLLLNSVQSLNQTKQTHALALVFGRLPWSVPLCASLIQNYAKFGTTRSSRVLFERTVYSPKAYMWNTLLRGYAVNGDYDVFGIFNRMISSGVRPDDHSFPIVLKACADFGSVEKGKEIHGFAIKVGFDRNLYLGSTLMLLYCRCDDLGCARKVFDEMPERFVVSWTTLIGALSDRGDFEEALGMYFEMKIVGGCLPDEATVVSILPACAELKGEFVAREIQGFVVKVGLICQLRVGIAFIDVYGKCGKVESSMQVFDEMEDKNVVSWNAVITSLVHSKCYDEALRMFRLMIDAKVALDGVTISSMLPVVVELEYFDAGKEIHGVSIRKELDSDLFILNSLLDMYSKSGHLAEASRIFSKMSVRDVVTWSTMVANFARNDNELAAIGLVREMQALGVTPDSVTFINVLSACARIGALASGKEVHAKCIRNGAVSNIIVSNVLIYMYTKCGFLDLAQNVFDTSLRDQVSYNTLIIGYSQSVHYLRSLDLFKEMAVKGLEQDSFSFLGAIAACTNSMALKSGKEIHGAVTRRLLRTPLFVSNSLLDFYIKCGEIDIAQKIFDRKHNKDVSWNTMILGYGMRGKFEMAIDLFEAMREHAIKPDSFSFVAVLTACSHGGLVEKGKKYFDEMQAKNINPTPIHYTCMVDLLGRAGLMQEAVDLIRDLPFEPDANIWSALLGASRLHGDIELAKLAAEHLFVLKPEDYGYYVLLSNMLSEAGRWDEATKVRELMKSRAAKKNPAYSWVLGHDVSRHYLVGENSETSEQVDALSSLEHYFDVLKSPYSTFHS